MNAARIEKSDRLQRVLSVLWDHKPRTTRQIAREANVCAVNSCVSELRQAGKHVECWRSGDRWYYQLNNRREDNDRNRAK